MKKLSKLKSSFKLTMEEEVVFQILNRNIDKILNIDVDVLIKNMRKMAKSPLLKQNRTDLLTELFLPFNTKNDEWMVDYISVQLGLLRNKTKDESLNISKVMIRKYVTTSLKFADYRNQCEQAITRAYMNIHKLGKDDFYFTEDEVKEERNTTYYNHSFRDNVIKAMSGLGLSRDNINAGIELNRKDWVSDVYKCTFNNIIGNSKVVDMVKNKKPVLHDRYLLHCLDELDGEMFYYYYVLLENEYYHTNKHMIDKLGTATPEMKIKSSKKNEYTNKLFDLVTVRRQILAKMLSHQKTDDLPEISQ